MSPRETSSPPTGRVQEFRGASPFFASLAGKTAAALVWLLAFAVSESLLVAGITLVLLAPVYAMSTRLEIGPDGITVSWWGWARFARWSDIERVDVFRAHKEVRYDFVLSTGRTIAVAIRTPAIERAVMVAMAGAADGRELDTEMLARRRRALSDWVAELYRLGAGAQADMRRSPIPLERFFQILEAPNAAAIDRAAAAMAIRSVLADEDRVRLQTVARNVAAPHLRALLEAVADDAGDDTVERAFAKVLGEPPPATATPLRVEGRARLSTAGKRVVETRRGPSREWGIQGAASVVLASFVGIVSVAVIGVRHRRSHPTSPSVAGTPGEAALAEQQCFDQCNGAVHTGDQAELSTCNRACKTAKQTAPELDFVRTWSLCAGRCQNARFDCRERCVTQAAAGGAQSEPARAVSPH